MSYNNYHGNKDRRKEYPKDRDYGRDHDKDKKDYVYKERNQSKYIDKEKDDFAYKSNNRYNKDDKSLIKQNMNKNFYDHNRKRNDNLKFSHSSERDNRRRSSSLSDRHRKKSNYKKMSHKQRSRSRSYSRSLSSSSSSSSSYKAIKKSKNTQQTSKPQNKKPVINSTEKLCKLILIYIIVIEPEKELCLMQSQIQSSSKHQKELSNTLIISYLGPDINLSILEDVIREICLELQTSMPDDIRFIESIRVAYVIFPSIPAATKVYESLGGFLSINGNSYEIDYTPNVSNNVYNPNPNKTSITYITSVSDYNAYTTALETTVHEDWICEFVFIYNYHLHSVIVKIFLREWPALNVRGLRQSIVE
jgi:hypothetical protein